MNGVNSINWVLSILGKSARCGLPALLCVSISTTVVADDSALRVVVDTAPVAALTAAVMQGVGVPATLVDVAASAHHAQLKPSQVRVLRNADVVIHISKTFTPWLTPKLAALPKETRVLELMELANTQRLAFRKGPIFGVDEAEDDEEHDHKHAHDDHGSVDDHGWLAPENALLWLDEISTQLQQADPVNADAYQRNAVAAVSRLQLWIEQSGKRLEVEPQAPYMVYHDAFQYFEMFAGLPAAAAIADSHAEKPGAKRLQTLQRYVTDNNVSCLLVDARQPLQLVDSVFTEDLQKRQRIDMAVTNAEEGLDAYLALLDRLVNALVDCTAGEGS